MAQKGQYDPWAIPDDFTVFKSAPDWLQPLLHPHWKTQKAMNPFLSYFCGLYLLVGGNLSNVFSYFILINHIVCVCVKY